MHFGFEHKPFGVYQEVALSAADLLSTVVTTLLSAYPGRLDRLGIHYCSTGLGIAPESNAQTLTEGPVDPFPDTAYAPLPEVMKDGFPRWEVVGKQAQGTATSQDVEDGVEYVAKAVDPRALGRPVAFGAGR